MKIKHFLYGGLGLGLAAGLLRISQYIFTIDEQGFFRTGNSASLLNGCLVGLLLIGCLWSFLAKMQKKEQVTAKVLFPRGAADLIFGGLALLSAAFGIYRIYLAATHSPLSFHLSGGLAEAPFSVVEPAVNWLEILVGVLCLLGACGWIVLCYRRETGFALLPILQLGTMIIDYFWATYQYIHVSGYILMTLGLCTVLLYTVSLAKASVGAVCSCGRLTGVSVLVLCAVPACFVEGFFNPTLPNLLLALLGVLFYALAILTLLQLTKPQPMKTTELEAEMPDLSELNQYFSEIPEEEQEDEQKN